MIIILTTLTLCICSTIGIVLTYLITRWLLTKFRKCASYVVFGGYIVFIFTNLFIWLCLYKYIYTIVSFLLIAGGKNVYLYKI